MNYLPERDLLPYLLTKDNYNSFFSSIDLDHIRDNYRELWYLYQTVKTLREEFPDKDFNLDEFQTYFFVKNKDADPDIYLELFKTLSEAPIDQELGLGILKDIKRRKTASILSEEAFRYATGSGSIPDILKIAKDLEEAQEGGVDSDIVVVSDDLELLLEETISTPGLRWRLECLNKSLGSMRKGDFGFIFARPETGKTTFLASEVSHMLTQLKDDSGPVVWLNLEEQGNKVMLRVYQAYFGITLQQLLANPKKYREEFQKQVKGRFKLVDNAALDRQTVENLLKQWNPSLVVQDQTPKIKGFAADREDLRLGSIFLWSRELAKRYCPIIGVIQAGGQAENQKWLTMDHVDNVKTAAQAEADWIVGIGKTHTDGFENIRYLNLSKNKLAGDSDSIPDLRHGRFEAYLNLEVARYEDVMKFE